MKKNIFLFAILFFSLSVNAQVSTVDKSGTARTTDRVVEISAEAIPYSQIGSVVIDSSTYHKAVGISREHHIVEVQAVAVSAGSVQPVDVKKEAVTVHQSGKSGSESEKAKMVEVKVEAIKR